MGEGTGKDSLTYVMGANLHRRHLNESQRSAVAGRVANMTQGARTDLEPSANLQKVSQAEAAEMFNVSTRSVASAAKVQSEAQPEVVAAMDQGCMSVSLAARVAVLTCTMVVRVFGLPPSDLTIFFSIVPSFRSPRMRASAK